jgi:hypothetical protein
MTSQKMKTSVKGVGNERRLVNMRLYSFGGKWVKIHSIQLWNDKYWGQMELLGDRGSSSDTLSTTSSTWTDKVVKLLL